MEHARAALEFGIVTPPTNSGELARALSMLEVKVLSRTTLPDDLTNADLVVSTGGLGPLA